MYMKTVRYTVQVYKLVGITELFKQSIIHNY